MNRIQRTVLVIDASLENHQKYQQYLQLDQSQYDYTVLRALSGQEGFEQWQQHQPDAVLLDDQLPDLDCLDFLVTLQDQTQQAILPVILMTTSGSEALARQASVVGAYDYVVKDTVQPESLRLALNGAVKTALLDTLWKHRLEQEQIISQRQQQLACEQIILQDIGFLEQLARQLTLVSDHALPDQSHLVLNGLEISASVDEQERLILAIAPGELGREVFVEWLQQHTTPR